MELKFAIICDNAFTDVNGRLNIIQTFDKIKASQLPAFCPRITLITNFELSESDDRAKKYTQKVTLVNKKTNTAISQLFVTVSPESQATTNIQFIAYFIGLTLDEAIYEIRAHIEGEAGSAINQFSVEQ